MGSSAASLEEREGGARILRSTEALGAYPRAIIDTLDHWAALTPEQVLFADRGEDGAWRKVTYAEARARARSIAADLLGRGLSADRPIAILSGNEIEHALLALGAMYAGIAYAPLSPAYSLVSSDFVKLKHAFDLLTPGLVYVSDGVLFGPALNAVMRDDIGLVVRRNPPTGRQACLFDDLVRTPADDNVDRAADAVTPDTIVKFLMTSGSTGLPKAVINTQRMLTCNQVMINTALAFLKDEPPVMVDWLPWNHTAGGNHNFGIALTNGGTLYIDNGTPTPAGIERTVLNLSDIAPTLYFNVPKGYEMLVEHLQKNDALRNRFFSRVKLLQYAGAGLPQHVWDALERLALETIGEKIMIVTGYGSTETAPFASTTTWAVNRPGEIGLPAAGLTFKLVPDGRKLELRLKGPNITPGYWRQPDKTAESFDEEGFYRIGDAVKFVDPGDIGKGLLFDGRTSEDFKLTTATWVNMGAIRASIVNAFAPYVRDAVITGADRDYVGALVFLDVDACRRIDPALADAGEAMLASDDRLRSMFQERLDRLAGTATGSSTRVCRMIVLGQPPSVDRLEMTDKGSINQRAVMDARPALVADLYTDPAPHHVLVARNAQT